jgi:hypothetical protein
VVGKYLVPSKKAIKWWLIPKNQIKKAGRKRRKEERALFQPFTYFVVYSALELIWLFETLRDSRLQ